MLPIETSRLILRELAASDLPSVISYYCDPEVTAHMVWGPVNTPEDAANYLNWAIACQNAQPRRTWELAVTLRGTGEVIGSVELEISNAAHQEGEIGYLLARAHWGRGYATEAARAITAFGFDQLGLHRIWATCSPANPGSARVLQKCGMAREGHLRAHRLLKDGTWRDSLLYAVLENEYEPG